MSKIKVGLLGCGNIADFHVKSLKASGINVFAVAGSYNSKNVYNFAKKHKIPNIWKDPLELADKRKDYVDGFIVTVPHKNDIALKYLNIITKTNMPALFEKPIVADYRKLIKFKNKSNNILLAYNRRYYSSVNYAKLFIEKNNPCIVQVEIPENLKKIKGKEVTENIFSNSVHIFDLLRFLLGDLTFQSKLVFNNHVTRGVCALFSSKNESVVNITCNFSASTNFNIKIDSGKKRIQLYPIEKASLYDGISSNKISKSIKTYTPNLKKNYKIPKFEKKLKPGFFKQSIEFKKFIKYNKSNISAKICDAIEALKIAEKIVS